MGKYSVAEEEYNIDRRKRETFHGIRLHKCANIELYTYYTYRVADGRLHDVI